jgi:hypothetical protein
VISAIATGWDAEEARMDGGAEADERADDAEEELRWFESLSATGSANENGETRDMELQSDPKFNDEGVERALTKVVVDTHSGIYKTVGSKPLTVEEIDALPAQWKNVEERQANALNALSLLSIDTLHKTLADMLSRLEDERVVALVLERTCRLSTEDVGHIAEQLMQRLFNQYTVERRIADAARNRQRAAETVICRVLGDNAVFAVDEGE